MHEDPSGQRRLSAWLALLLHEKARSVFRQPAFPSGDLVGIDIELLHQLSLSKYYVEQSPPTSIDPIDTAGLPPPIDRESDRVSCKTAGCHKLKLFLSAHRSNNF
jgi:hypothetical protein